MKKSITWKLAFACFGVFWFFVLYFFVDWVVSDAKQNFQQSQVATVEETEIITEEEVVVTATGPTVEEEYLRDERYCLALNIYHESRGDSFAGQSAVADVVMNRVEDSYYPNTVCEVVKQTVWVENWKGNMVPKRHMCQFSWFCDGVSDEPGDPDAWAESYMMAEEVFDKGNWRGITEGATHYHSLQVRPKWVKDRGMEYTGTIGQHEFYRWER
jgi:spore germination cell wall hydrolase CwlJ-like protein